MTFNEIRHRFIGYSGPLFGLKEVFQIDMGEWQKPTGEKVYKRNIVCNHKKGR